MRSKFISLENLARFKNWISVAFDALQEALAPVATSGSYNDLDDKPTIPSSTVTMNVEFTDGSTGTYNVYIQTPQQQQPQP